MEEARKIIVNILNKKKKAIELIKNDLEKSKKILHYLLKIQTVAPRAIKEETVAELQEIVNMCETTYLSWQKSVEELEAALTNIKSPEEKTIPEIETPAEKKPVKKEVEKPKPRKKLFGRLRKPKKKSVEKEENLIE